MLRSFLLRVMALTLLVAGCAGNGWRSETVVHARYVTDGNLLTSPHDYTKPQPSGTNPFLAPSVCTIVELGDSQDYEVPGTDATQYLTPGASVQLYSASSTDGNKYYSLRASGLGTAQVLAVALPEAQSC
jgi:hypothetical protein